MFLILASYKAGSSAAGARPRAFWEWLLEALASLALLVQAGWGAGSSSRVSGSSERSRGAGSRPEAGPSVAGGSGDGRGLAQSHTHTHFGRLSSLSSVPRCRPHIP